MTNEILLIIKLSGLLILCPYFITPLLANNFHMTENKFWEIIENSKNAITDKESAEQIENKLNDLSPAKLVDFYLLMEKYRAMAYKRDLYGAGSLLSGRNLSDDSFWYFTCWLVSRGKQTYQSALNNADSLADLPANLENEYGVDVYFQSYCGIVYDIFEFKTGRNIYDEAKHQYEKDNDWFGYTTDELKLSFPKLWAKYGYLRTEPSLIETLLTDFIVNIVVFFIKVIEIIGQIFVGKR